MKTKSRETISPVPISQKPSPHARNRDSGVGEYDVVFGEHTWDILLRLYVAQSDDRVLSKVKVATAANVPQSTGLRMLTPFEDRGPIVRSDDPTTDGVRSYPERGCHCGHGGMLDGVPRGVSARATPRPHGIGAFENLRWSSTGQHNRPASADDRV